MVLLGLRIKVLRSVPNSTGSNVFFDKNLLLLFFVLLKGNRILFIGVVPVWRLKIVLSESVGLNFKESRFWVNLWSNLCKYVGIISN